WAVGHADYRAKVAVLDLGCLRISVLWGRAMSNIRPGGSFNSGNQDIIGGNERAMLVNDLETDAPQGDWADDPAGRTELFIRLLGQSHRSLHLYVMSLVPNRNDAEDILQQTNLVLWREFHQFEPGTNFTAWACRVAFNQVLAWRKRRQRDRLVFSE